jgi:hypothetical protein
MELLLIALVVGLPVAWLASEFRPRRWPRVLLGCCAILSSFAVAALVGSLDRFNSNSWYGDSSDRLIAATVGELEMGNTDRVVDELRRLRGRFHPTYENRARYDELVEEYLTRVGAEGDGRTVPRDWPGLSGRLCGAARRYAARKLGWADADYSVRCSGEREGDNFLVQLVHKDDVRDALERARKGEVQFGGGKSVLLHIDPVRDEVVKELHYQ